MRRAVFDGRRIVFRGQFPRDVCAKGHRLTEGNIVVQYDKRIGRISQTCLACKRASNREHMRRKRAA